MRRLRHRLLQRFVALLLLAGGLGGLVPEAAAQSGSPTPGRLGGRTLDIHALSAAAAAARRAPTRAAAADAFVAAYVAVRPSDVSARELYRLLLGDAVGGVPPAAPEDAVVQAAPPAAPAAHTPGAGLLAVGPRLPASGTLERPADEGTHRPDGEAARRARPARAP